MCQKALTFFQGGQQIRLVINVKVFEILEWFVQQALFNETKSRITKRRLVAENFEK